jgi:hypothetical protein
VILVNLARLHYLQNNLEQAKAHASQAHTLSIMLGFTDQLDRLQNLPGSEGASQQAGD